MFYFIGLFEELNKMVNAKFLAQCCLACVKQSMDVNYCDDNIFNY